MTYTFNINFDLFEISTTIFNLRTKLPNLLNFHESNKEETNKVSSCLSQILRHYQSKRFVLLVLVLAWAVIPQDMKWTLFDGRIVINSWRLFLLISTVLPLIAGVGSAFCHESPRFLMAKGRKDKALRVFQSIYSVNTGNPQHTYSVTLAKYAELQI